MNKQRRVTAALDAQRRPTMDPYIKDVVQVPTAIVIKPRCKPMCGRRVQNLPTFSIICVTAQLPSGITGTKVTALITMIADSAERTNAKSDTRAKLRRTSSHFSSRVLQGPSGATSGGCHSVRNESEIVARTAATMASLLANQELCSARLL